MEANVSIVQSQLWRQYLADIKPENIFLYHQWLRLETNHCDETIQMEWHCCCRTSGSLNSISDPNKSNKVCKTIGRKEFDRILRSIPLKCEFNWSQCLAISSPKLNDCFAYLHIYGTTGVSVGRQHWHRIDAEVMLWLSFAFNIRWLINTFFRMSVIFLLKT